jgi:TRAP-type C4-dicarboxylate transport system permease small subunit
MYTHAVEEPVFVTEGPAPLYTRFCAALARFCLRLGVAGMCLLLVAVLYQVVGRYIFNDTPTWAESGAVLLVLYVTMLVRLVMERVIHVLVLVFGLVMAWNCGLLAASVWDYKIPTLGISEAFKYIPPAMAGALVALFSLEHLVALARGIEVEPSWH